MMAPAREITAREHQADGVVHVIGLAFAFVAAPVLVLAAALQRDVVVLAACLPYALALMATVTASAAYNMAPATTSSARIETLRRIDHSMIFFKIAGTYTPFAAISLGQGSGLRLLGAVWAVALIGGAVKIASPRRLEVVSVVLYLALGWSFLWVLREASAIMAPDALALLAIGGVLYSVGVIFHLWDTLPFQNAIWHLHVLVATICMYAAVIVELF